MPTELSDAPLIIETGPEPRHAVIWLHGLGADGHDFEPLIPELRLPPEKPVRFVFPHAPVRPISINAGYSMRGWYDVHSLEMTDRQDEDGIRQSARITEQLVEEQERAGIPRHNIILAGFSQGGAVALFTGLRLQQPVAGILALSTYLPLEAAVNEAITPAGRNTPVFMAHGEADEIIRMHFAEHSRDALRGLGVDVDWHRFPMGHGLCPQEIHDLRRWLLARLD